MCDNFKMCLLVKKLIAQSKFVEFHTSYNKKLWKSHFPVYELLLNLHELHKEIFSKYEGW